MLYSVPGVVNIYMYMYMLFAGRIGPYRPGGPYSEKL